VTGGASLIRRSESTSELPGELTDAVSEEGILIAARIWPATTRTAARRPITSENLTGSAKGA
jgi:hypothetical protein